MNEQEGVWGEDEGYYETPKASVRHSCGRFSESKNLKAREYEEMNRRVRHKKKNKCTDSLNMTSL